MKRNRPARKIDFIDAEYHRRRQKNDHGPSAQYVGRSWPDRNGWLVLAGSSKEFIRVSASKRRSRLKEDQIPEALKIVMFRLLQEAFHNIGKYSRADSVKLSFLRRRGALELTIKDNGEGFDVVSALSRESGARGLGLTSMKERTELSGGSFSISSKIGKGTAIRASWRKAGEQVSR